MVINENILRQQEQEMERHNKASAEQEKLLLKYLDCVNNGDMTISDFISKTDGFTEYCEDIAANAAKQIPIDVPIGLVNRMYK